MARNIGLEQRALATLEAIAHLSEPERQRYITRLGDPDLASRVVQLLGAMDTLDEARDISLGGLSIEAPDASLEGERVGPYLLNALVGAGGMGVVYHAARDDGAFSRDVAIKFFSSIAPETLRRRFSMERQLLARLDHPNIARLIDGGSVELAGQMQPYLAMEYVEGAPFAYDAQRSSEETVRLFLKVCSAVHYAHGQLVLHRDLKPANVLLGADGEPKLLDFGVAKLLDASHLSSLTQLVPVALTFNFAAPEVLAGEPSSVSSEVYALGVFLHVVLYGEQPYDLARTAFPAMAAAVREALPPTPGGNAALDAIISKAMHVDAGRRYASVASLAEDLERYLSGHAVRARGDDWRYRSGRFLRRHALAVGIAVSVGLGLAGATAVATYQARLAQDAAETSQRTLSFLQSLFSAADPQSGEPLGPDGTLSELLLLAERLAEDSFEGDPDTRMDIYLLLAQTWLGMMQLPEAEQLRDQAQALLESHGDRLVRFEAYQRLLTNLDVALAVSGTRWSDAVALCNAAPHLTQGLAEDYAHLSTQLSCANASFNTGDNARSIALTNRARAVLDEPGAISLQVSDRLAALMSIANIYLGIGDEPTIVAYLDRAEAVAQDLGESGLATLSMLYIMRSILPNQRGEAEASLRYTTLAMEAADASPLGADQVMYAYVQLYHADRLIDVGDLDAAAPVFANAKRVLLERTPATSHYHATTHFTEYKLAFLAEDFPRAEQALLTARGIREAGGEAYTPWQAMADYGLGKIYLAQERYVEAVARITPALAFYRNFFGDGHPTVARYEDTLARAEAGAAGLAE